MTFRFDPNSTKNEGRWRLIDPAKFIKGSKGWFRRKDPKYSGISYVYGPVEGSVNPVRQTIRFDKRIWSEEKASEWWEEHQDEYYKEWTEKDWIIKELNLKDAIKIGKEIIEKLKFNFVPPENINSDSKWKARQGMLVGSIRRKKEFVGDVDILFTSQITKEKIARMTDFIIIRGKMKKIDFYYVCKNGYLRVNLFFALDKNTFGASLLHFSGPVMYNTRLRKRFTSKKWIDKHGEGWKLSQNGLFDGQGESIKTPTERSLQKALGITEREIDTR